MSRGRNSEYQVQCPKCQEFFAWHHVCPKKKRNRQLLRGSGENRMKLVGWVKADCERRND